MAQIRLNDGILVSGDPHKTVNGIVEFVIKDKCGNVIQRMVERNIVKIFAKEMLSHRLSSSQIWDPLANGGVGAWVDTNNDPTEEFSVRYILFGASFDVNGVPLDTNDTRYYTLDTVTGTVIPVRLGPGAEYNGGLINAIPIAEPDRPLKRIESVTYNATYQPAGTPLLQSDVRAMNNIVKFQTTLRLEEYNGFGLTSSDYFTITEVALAGGKKFDTIGACESDPKTLFLEGVSGSNNGPLLCSANGSDIISLDPSVVEVDLIKKGDQIKIVGADDTAGTDSIDQITPFYSVLEKNVGGRDIQLDRVPVNRNNVAISGAIGIYRSTLRIFSHRVLSAPVKKSDAVEIDVIWSIIFS